MRLSQSFFRALTCWWGLLLGNILILGMVLAVLYANGHVLAACMAMDLRSETISTIVIAWGVLLESREDLIHGGSPPAHLAEKMDGLVGSESKRSGLLFVCLGLLLEIITYFDASVHMQPSPAWVTIVLHGIVWLLLVMICAGFFISSLNLARIRFKGDNHADQKI